MLALRSDQVKMDRAAEGFVGELSEIMSKVFFYLLEFQKTLMLQQKGCSKLLNF